MKCYFCDSPVNINDRKCSSCNKKLEKFCASCDKLYELGGNFCISCGGKLQDREYGQSAFSEDDLVVSASSYVTTDDIETLPNPISTDEINISTNTISTSDLSISQLEPTDNKSASQLPELEEESTLPSNSLDDILPEIELVEIKPKVSPKKKAPPKIPKKITIDKSLIIEESEKLNSIGINASEIVIPPFSKNLHAVEVAADYKLNLTPFEEFMRKDSLAPSIEKPMVEIFKKLNYGRGGIYFI